MTDHHLGDFSITLPAINTLAEYFDDGITLAISSRHCHLVNLLPARDKIKILAYRDEKKTIADFFAVTRFMLKITLGRYRKVIAISYRNKCCLFTLASLAKHRIGFENAEKNWVFNEKLQPISSECKFNFYSRVLTKIGVNGAPKLVPFIIPQDKKNSADQIITESFTNTQRPLAIIHPTAGKEKRYWPKKKFARTINEIIRQYDMNICLIGTPDEIDTLNKLKQQVGDDSRCAIVIKPLDTILAILTRGDLLISNLSGPTHLATLCSKIPIVTICEVGVRDRWALIRKENTIMLNQPCTECIGRKCKTLKCIHDVSVEQVLQEIEKFKAYWQPKAPEKNHIGTLTALEPMLEIIS